jgi:cation transport ATPase
MEGIRLTRGARTRPTACEPATTVIEPTKERVVKQLTEADVWEDEESTADGHRRLAVRVGGMNCSLCPGIIERRLGSEPGVHDVAVTLADERAVVEYDPARLTREQVVGSVRDLGFTIGDPGSERAASEEASELTVEGRRTVALFALSAVTVPLMFLEMWDRAGGWVGWVLGAFSVAASCWPRNW